MHKQNADIFVVTTETYERYRKCKILSSAAQNLMRLSEIASRQYSPAAAEFVSPVMAGPDLMSLCDISANQNDPTTTCWDC